MTCIWWVFQIGTNHYKSLESLWWADPRHKKIGIHQLQIPVPSEFHGRCTLVQIIKKGTFLISTLFPIKVKQILRIMQIAQLYQA